RDIVYKTTNGTQAINLIKECPAVIIACFNNLSAAAKWLSVRDHNVLLLCAGWKQKFSLEDSVFAGAMVEELLKYHDYKIHCDSALASLDLWNIAKADLREYMEKAL